MREGKGGATVNNLCCFYSIKKFVVTRFLPGAPATAILIITKSINNNAEIIGSPCLFSFLLLLLF